MRVTILGTGTMGAGLAGSLLKAGHDVTVWNRTADRARRLVEQGAELADSPADAVRETDAVLTMLFDERAVREVAEQFLPALPEDAVWLQTATVGVEGARALAALADEHGATAIDAPVVGTKQPAEQGALVVLVSGDVRAIERVRPVLDAIGSRTVVAGERPGQASALKLACNAWVASLTAGIAQSVQMCRAFGLDPQLFLDSIEGGATDSGYARVKGAAMIEGDFAPSFAVAGLLKDIELMLAALTGTQGSDRILRPLRQAYGEAAQGHADDDIAAVVEVFGPAR